MKKLLTKTLVTALGIGLVSSVALAAELYNPKSEKNHLVIPMEALSQEGNKNVGEVVAVETKYGVALSEFARNRKWFARIPYPRKP